MSGLPYVQWHFRPLADFNDQSLSEIAKDYDLMVVDYPHTGSAAASGVLSALDTVVPTERLKEIAADSVGPTYSSFTYDDHQWALPIDAACQVSAVRPDLLYNTKVPESWNDFLKLARERSGQVALPLYHSDAICCVLTLTATLGSPPTGGEALFSEHDAAERALDNLAELAPLLHPISFENNPPAVLDHMVATDEIFAVPLVFGYTYYAQKDMRRAVQFGLPPSLGNKPGTSILGGAGVAISAQSSIPEQTAEFVAWLADGDTQRDLMGPAGGQPSSRQAWDDTELDTTFGGFFSGTREAIERAYVRPSEPWWPDFFRIAGPRVGEWLRQPTEAYSLIEELEDLYRKQRKQALGGHAHV